MMKYNLSVAGQVAQVALGVGTMSLALVVLPAMALFGLVAVWLVPVVALLAMCLLLMMDKEDAPPWRIGSHRTYSADGTLREDATYLFGVRHGVSHRYYGCGRPSSSTEYWLGLPHGRDLGYSLLDSGRVVSEGRYHLGKPVGPRLGYVKEHTDRDLLVSVAQYKDGILDGLQIQLVQGRTMISLSRYKDGALMDSRVVYGGVKDIGAIWEAETRGGILPGDAEPVGVAGEGI